MAVVTHCDLLEPKAIRLDRPADSAKEDLDEKVRHVAAAERAVARKLDSRPKLRDRHVATLGISAYMSWREEGPDVQAESGRTNRHAVLRADERWRIEDLAVILFRHLPDAGRAELARVTQARAVQEELATSLTKATAAICAGIAAAPIPFADVFPLTTLQAGLVAGIAWIGGRSVDKRGTSEFMASLGVNVGAAFALREAFRGLMKLIAPGSGPVVSAAIAFSGTMAMGAAARAYFVRGVSLRDARRIFRRQGAKKD